MAYQPSTEKMAGEEDKKDTAATPQADVKNKMFQRLQFLVRDYQNFDDEDLNEDTIPSEFYALPEAKRAEIFKRLEKGMAVYLRDVINPKNQAKDLKVTRDQISRVFQKVDCFCLPHPGKKVINKSYDGSINQIDFTFKILVNKFIRKVIDEDLEAKKINERNMTGPELKIFFESYFTIIRDSNNIPEPMTMLEASALANNRSAFSVALESYKCDMDIALGVIKPSMGNTLKKLTSALPSEAIFIKEPLLKEKHLAAKQNALIQFDSRAKLGPQESIQKYRDDLEAKIDEEWARIRENNELRNPFKDSEQFAIPIAVGAASWFLSKLINAFCSHSACNVSAGFFHKLFLLIFIGFVFFFWQKIQNIFIAVSNLVGASASINTQNQKLKAA